MLTDDQIEALSEMRAHAIIGGLTDPTSKFEAEALAAAIEMARKFRDAPVVTVRGIPGRSASTSCPPEMIGKRVALVRVEG